MRLSLIVIALVLLAGVAQAGTWDLAADFSASNPSGSWTYGVYNG